MNRELCKQKKGGSRIVNTSQAAAGIKLIELSFNTILSCNRNLDDDVQGSKPEAVPPLELSTALRQL